MIRVWRRFLKSIAQLGQGKGERNSPWALISKKSFLSPLPTSPSLHLCSCPQCLCSSRGNPVLPLPNHRSWAVQSFTEQCIWGLRRKFLLPHPGISLCALCYCLKSSWFMLKIHILFLSQPSITFFHEENLVYINGNKTKGICIIPFQKRVTKCPGVRIGQCAACDLYFSPQTDKKKITGIQQDNTLANWFC